MLLENQIALVTGGSRGIGKACVLALAKEGADILFTYVSSDDKAKEVCDEVLKLGRKVEAIKVDLSNDLEIESKLAPVLKNKSVSILLNNSGITKDGLMLRYSVVDWNSVLNTNLRASFLVSQIVIKNMMKERKGSIIHMSSVVGMIGNAGQVAYCASKAGLIGLTKSMARELSSRNIRVNAIAPGFIETDMTEKLSPEQKQELVKQIPLKRVGKAEDIAQAVIYLASENSNYMTGQVIVVDGGMSM